MLHGRAPETGKDSRQAVALLLLVAFAFGLRWYYVSVASVDHPIRGDATQYYNYALNLLNHGTFSKDSPDALAPVPDNYRDPGYPFFLYLWMLLLGTSKAWYGAVLLSQAALGALTVGLATRLGRFWLTPAWTLGTGLLMAAWPHVVTINGYILSETLFGFLCTAALLLCVESCHRRSMGLAAVCGLMFGAAALTNSVLLPFGVVCSGVLLWKKLAPRTLCAAIAIASLALPCAWGVRNLQLADTATTSVASDRALQNLVQGSWPEYHSAWRAGIGGGTEGKATLEGIDQEYRRIKTSFPDGASAIMQRLAEHPLDAMAWYLLRKPYLLWDWDIRIGQGDIYVFPTNNSPFQTNPFLRLWASICRGFNPLLALFALGSIWFLHQGTNGESAIPGARCGLVVTIVLLAYVTVVYSVLQAEPRYSIPFRPLEILLAVAALHAATALSRKRIARVGDSESGR